MLCCICKEKEATVHLTQTVIAKKVIAKNEVRTMDLCEECAEKKGVNDPTGFSLAEHLLGIEFSPQTSQNRLHD